MCTHHKIGSFKVWAIQERHDRMAAQLQGQALKDQTWFPVEKCRVARYTRLLVRYSASRVRKCG